MHRAELSLQPAASPKSPQMHRGACLSCLRAVKVTKRSLLEVVSPADDFLSLPLTGVLRVCVPCACMESVYQGTAHLGAGNPLFQSGEKAQVHSVRFLHGNGAS